MSGLASPSRTPFQRWIGEIDDLCFQEFGMSIHDLPDMPFFDSFESGLAPTEFMEEFIPDLDALGSLILS